MIKEINSLLAATAKTITDKIPEENKMIITPLHSDKELHELLKTEY